jgi:transposase-like protein
MATRKRPKRSGYANDTHYFDCPDCGPQVQVGQIGQDIQGRPVYGCPSCQRRFGSYGLDREARERRMRD